MKSLLFLSMLGIPLWLVNNQLSISKKSPASISCGTDLEKRTVSSTLNLQPEPGPGKMSAIEFKTQEYCRVELEDFEFDARFSVVSATVYFSGANFRAVERGYIKGSSLRPIGALMARCIPGTIVVFDNIRAKGPDNEVRPIRGVTYNLF